MNRFSEATKIFNRRRSAVLSCPDRKEDEVQKSILEEILDYTHLHWAVEGDLTRKAIYPDAYNHWRKHTEFSKLVYKKTETSKKDR